jgi:hypothetical protein
MTTFRCNRCDQPLSADDVTRLMARCLDLTGPRPPYPDCTPCRRAIQRPEPVVIRYDSRDEYLTAVAEVYNVLALA